MDKWTHCLDKKVWSRSYNCIHFSDFAWPDIGEHHDAEQAEHYAHEHPEWDAE